MNRPIRSLWVCVLALSFLALEAMAGDAAAAKTLFDGGQKALRSRKYADAAALFGKAWVEDPTLTEAIYWKAFSEEKGRDEASALETYRDFLEALEKKGLERVSSEERKLRKRARDRVRALAVAEGEFDDAEEKYVAALLAIMKRRAGKGETVAALQAAQRILEVEPDHEEALEARRKLAPDADPYAEVAEWTLPIRERLINGKGCEYVDDALVMDVTGGGMMRFTPPQRLSGGFAYETGFRVVETYDGDWAVGLVFGDDGAHVWVLSVRAAKVELQWGEKGKPPQTVGSAALATVDREKPHTLGLLVRDGVLLCRLDGEVLIRAAAEGRATDGEIGVYMSHCRAEHRGMRAGRLP